VAVLPGGIDDPAATSGGNRYDRVVLSLLSGADPTGAPIAARDVHEIAISGSWPSPGAPARAALSALWPTFPTSPMC